jgi:hypothetical protein
MHVSYLQCAAARNTQVDAVCYRESGADLVWPKLIPRAPHMAHEVALALREGGGEKGG